MGNTDRMTVGLVCKKHTARGLWVTSTPAPAQLCISASTFVPNHKPKGIIYLCVRDMASQDLNTPMLHYRCGTLYDPLIAGYATQSPSPCSIFTNVHGCSIVVEL